MSYKLMINAMSRIGDDAKSANEAFYADKVTSVNSGVYAPLNLCTNSLGRKHVYSVFSGSESPDFLNRSLTTILDKQNTGNLSIKIQYALKDAVENICETESESSSDTALSLVYIDGQNVYMAGYGEVNVYRYNSKTKTVKREVFLGSGDNNTPAEPQDDNEVLVKKKNAARVRRISSLHSGDEYLIVGSNFLKVFSDEQIMEAFANQGKNTVNYLCEQARDSGCCENLSAIHLTIKKQRQTLYWSIGIAASVLVLTLLMMFGVFDKVISSQTDKQTNSSASSEGQSQSNSGKLSNDPNSRSDSTVTSDGTDLNQPNSLSGLEQQLDVIASEVHGENSSVAYYIKNLATGEVLEKNNSKMYSASLIKLYIMAEIYRQGENGDIEIGSNTKNLLTKMIAVSDNDACNSLATIAGNGDQQLGFQKITENAVNLGCTFTVQKNDLQAYRPVPIETGNFTSVKDCALILEKIYRKELVSEQASTEMLELLKKQERRWKIPRDLPKDVVIANKTGETSTAQNDVAIVFAGDTPYIICVMINDYANTQDEACDIIARMSKTTYDYITA